MQCTCRIDLATMDSLLRNKRAFGETPTHWPFRHAIGLDCLSRICVAMNMKENINRRVDCRASSVFEESIWT